MYISKISVRLTTCRIQPDNDKTTKPAMLKDYLKINYVVLTMEYEVEGSKPSTPKRMWTEVVQKDCQARNLNREDAMDHSRWKKLIKTG